MVSGNRSAWRRRRNRNRVARMAVPVAIPVAIGLVVAAVVAFSGGGHSANISQTALGAQASASPSASAAAPRSTATTTTGTGTTTTTAVANVNCDIIVPANPLTAQGLATPYQLTGTGGMSPGAVRLHHGQRGEPGRLRPGDHPEHANRAAVRVRPAGHHQGHHPGRRAGGADAAAAYIATIDFGFNGTNLTLVGATRTRCGTASASTA